MIYVKSGCSLRESRFADSNPAVVDEFVSGERERERERERETDLNL